MTEPLYLGLATAGVAALGEWCRSGRRQQAQWAGGLLALACLTRYEAWPVTAAALALAVAAGWRSPGGPVRTPAAVFADLRVAAIYPGLAVVFFAISSRAVIGSWYASGFFVPDNPAQGRPLVALASLARGIQQVAGWTPTTAAAVGASVLAWRVRRSRCDLPELLPLTLAAAALVACGAFVAGHPFRIRYVVPLMPAIAVCAGLSTGVWKRGRHVLAGILITFTAFERPPLAGYSPIAVEAQWDLSSASGRRRVTTCLEREYRGETIMASLGSLAHYIQELSSAGFSVGDFLHEGNGDIWLGALERPRPFVGWILIEEEAEGGGILARVAREHPAFLLGFERACEGGGVALYRRVGAPFDAGPTNTSAGRLLRSRP